MHEFIGWIGAFLYIAACFLLSIKKLTADKLIYQLRNIFGGLLFDNNSSHQHDNPSIVTKAV